MFHTIYRTTNLVNGKRYYGAHSTEELNDKYLGSGTAIQRAILKYGVENFKKDILCLCESEQEMYDLEFAFVDIRKVADKTCYNMTLGGHGGFSHINNNEESRLKLSRALKGKPSNFKGKKASEETRRKQSLAKLGKKFGPRGPYKKRVA